MTALGRHGQRPAHIHFFLSADDHRKLTTQINIDGDPLLNDDFAYATREGLVQKITERGDEASIKEDGMDGTLAEIELEFSMTALVDGVATQVNRHSGRAEGE